MRHESRADVAIIQAEALSKFMPVISAPKQFRDLARKKKEETERVEKIVEKAYHESTADELLSCRAESRHPVARPISSITGFLDFARNDRGVGGTKLRWRRRPARA